MKLFAMPILVVLILFSSCQPSGAKTQESGEAYSALVKAIIETKNAEITAALAAGDVDKAASNFAPDCVQLPPNQPAIEGIQAYKEYWNQSVQLGQWNLDLAVQEVKANGDLAMELGEYSLNFTPNPTSPIPATNDHGNYMVLWQRFDDDWKIVWDAPVSDVPLPPNPADVQ